MFLRFGHLNKAELYLNVLKINILASQRAHLKAFESATYAYHLENYEEAIKFFEESLRKYLICLSKIN